MEITTTMVRFEFPEKNMGMQSSKARLFHCFKDGDSKKIWVAKSKLSVFEGEDGNNTVVMPKWCFMKTDLPLFIDGEEFIYRVDVEDNDLQNQMSLQ